MADGMAGEKLLVALLLPAGGFILTRTHQQHNVGRECLGLPRRQGRHRDNQAALTKHKLGAPPVVPHIVHHTVAAEEGLIEHEGIVARSHGIC
ncbi:MAG: hypothetical protein AMK75_01605 [Planctomycetes bacterium SM23_65]|nr:MAG: hypothetical protein AMK75_01605 [Planctomycetes bacterium SM23_65]